VTHNVEAGVLVDLCPRVCHSVPLLNPHHKVLHRSTADNLGSYLGDSSCHFHKNILGVLLKGEGVEQVHIDGG
jgi:hypothetical protein